MRVFAFAGSLRADSMHKKLIALAAKAVERHGHDVDLADFGDYRMPLYDGDLESESGLPEAATNMAAKIRQADAMMIASPEYNFSVPGVVKNAIDWVSRDKPYPFKGKPTLLMSTSPSRVGGNRGLWALRVPLEALGTPVYPEMYSLPESYKAFDENGGLAEESQVERFSKLVEGFSHWADAQVKGGLTQD